MYDRVDVMVHEVVITTKDLDVVFATSGYHDLIKGKSTKSSKNLLKNIPALRKHLTKRVLLEGGLIEKLVLGDRIFTVQVIPSDNQLIFYFQSHDDSQSNLVPAHELKELRERNKLLEAIIEDAPIGLILFNENGIIEYINKKQEENSRKNRELVINHNIRDVFEKIFEYPQIAEIYNKLITNSDPNPCVIIDHYYPQFYRKDMVVGFFGRLLKEYNKIALFVEIEDDLYREKRKAEKAGEELRKSQSYLGQLLDASPNMVISVDGKRRVVSFNKTAERLLGFKANEVYNSPVDRFFPKEEFTKLDLAISSQVLWYGTSHIFRADRTSFPIELYSTKIKDERTGEDIATLLLAVDTDERNKLRKNLIQSQKMNFIGELVSGLAHQLNNPLVGVVNISDLLLEKIGKDDEKYQYIKMIKDAGENCRDVISRLLRFSRKQDDNPYVDVNLHSVLDAGIEMLNKHPKFKKVNVERYFESIPILRGDPVLLQQAFMNMLINSAQAIEDKGIIKVECKPISGMGRQIMVSISDNGCGIPEEDLPRLFDPFFSTKKAEDGTGIGLSLAYWIIQDHGGRITVDSAFGSGTIITTFFPMKG
ncbi:MAG: ATP-binding protein [Desulfomonilia bacterium]